MVIPDYLNFFSITFITNLQRYQNYYDKEFEVLEMVKNKLLELKLQNFCAGVPNGTPRQEIVNDHSFIFNDHSFILVIHATCNSWVRVLSTQYSVLSTYEIFHSKMIHSLLDNLHLHIRPCLLFVTLLIPKDFLKQNVKVYID